MYYSKNIYSKRKFNFQEIIKYLLGHKISSVYCNYNGWFAKETNVQKGICSLANYFLFSKNPTTHLHRYSYINYYDGPKSLSNKPNP